MKRIRFKWAVLVGLALVCAGCVTLKSFSTVGRSPRQRAALYAGGAAAQRLLSAGSGELSGKDLEDVERIGVPVDEALTTAIARLSPRLSGVRALAAELQREGELRGDDINRIMPRRKAVVLLLT